MNKTLIRVVLEVEVYDKDAFRNAAIEQAQKDGLEIGPDSGFDLRDLGDCAKMIFDPGVSPAGCQIEETTTEIIGGDDDDEDEEDEDGVEDGDELSGILSTVGLLPIETTPAHCR